MPLSVVRAALFGALHAARVSWHGGDVVTVAGSVELSAVMDELCRARWVFHSEADFQHAFAWAVHRLDGGINVRLEVRQAGGEHLDLLCFSSRGRTAIELKYFTAAWEGTDPGTGETFQLRAHAATDLARLHFVSDVERLERFCQRDSAGMTGLAVMLTNDRGLWSPPLSRTTRDQRFRIHEGQTLSGTLQWGIDPDFHAPNERTLAGSYVLRWHDYRCLDGRNSEFRWLGVAVHTASDTAADPATAGGHRATAGDDKPSAAIRRDPVAPN